jgi:Cu(I)/Ag(I) efflux system periplasmic protein CusF
MKAARLLILTTALSSGLAYAQMSGMSMPASPTASAGVSSRLTEGEALKVDVNTGKVILRHGPIENLGMPGMTMMFPVSDKKMLAGIKDGDKVRFRAERMSGTIVVTKIESSK